MPMVKGETYQCAGCGAEIEVTQNGGGLQDVGPTCSCGQVMKKMKAATASSIR